MLKEKVAGYSEMCLLVYQTAWHHILQEMYVLNIIRVLKLNTEHMEICLNACILCGCSNNNSGGKWLEFFSLFWQ